MCWLRNPFLEILLSDKEYLIMLGSLGRSNVWQTIFKSLVNNFDHIADMMKQGLQLAKKPHVVIATPGRLADHIQNTDTVSFKKIKFLVSLSCRYHLDLCIVGEQSD